MRACCHWLDREKANRFGAALDKNSVMELTAARSCASFHVPALRRQWLLKTLERGRLGLGRSLAALARPLQQLLDACLETP